MSRINTRRLGCISRNFVKIEKRGNSTYLSKKKNIQTFLLNFVLYKPIFTKQTFSLFLDYFESCHKSIKESFAAKCAKIIEDIQNDDFELFDGKTKVPKQEQEEILKIVKKRAAKIAEI